VFLSLVEAILNPYFPNTARLFQYRMFICISPLQEAELESIQMQAELDQMKEEKERLLNSLVEAE